MTTALAAFDRHRGLLFSVAYRMLGSAADAEDVVQDAWLRWSAAGRGEIADARAYLVRIATHLALDRLDSARSRRESYVGPWLPEPLVTGTAPVAGAPAPQDPAETVERGEEVSLAMLVVLETLSPAERAVFVLRDVFGLPVAEVATALGRTEAAVRQMGHRAREHVRARRPRFEPSPAVQREATERFLAACAGGDVDALLATLAPDVVLTSDGGGKARAALRPITGAEKVARFLLAISTTASDASFVVLPATVNGRPGVAAWQDGRPYLAATLVVDDGGLVEQVLMVRNPDKLRGLGDRPGGTS